MTTNKTLVSLQLRGAVYLGTIISLIVHAALIESHRSSAQVDEFSLDRTELTLKKENDFSAEVTVSSSDPKNVDVPECKDGEAIKPLMCTWNEGSRKITVRYPNSAYNTSAFERAILVSYSAGESKRTLSFTVKVPSRVVLTKLEVDGNSGKSAFVMRSNDKEKEVAAVYEVDGVPKSSITLAVVDSELVTVIENSKFKVSDSTARATPVKLDILANDAGGISISSILVEARPRIHSLSFSSTKNEVSEIDSRGFQVTAKTENLTTIEDLSELECFAEGTDEVFRNAINRVSIKDSRLTVRTGAIKREVDPKNTPSSISGNIVCRTAYKSDYDKFPVTVTRRSGYIRIENLSGTTLLPNGKVTFITRVYDEKDTRQAVPVTYDLENKEENEQWVSLTPEGDKLTVNWVNLPTLPGSTRPGFVSIRAVAWPVEAPYPVESTITVHLASVAKFSSLKVKLNLMDDRTAGDLYGNVTKDEYYVLMVRLFNDLKDRETNRYSGESILAYSSSLEVAVELEKKYDEDADAGTFGSVFDKKQMRALEEERKQKGYQAFKNSLDSLDQTFAAEYKKFEAITREAVKKETTALRLESDSRTNRALIPMARRARQAADQAYEEVAAVRNRLRNLYRYNLVTLPQIPLPDNVAINDGKWYPASRDDLMRVERQEAFLAPTDDDSIVSITDNEPNCVDTITYRPFTFEMMVNTVDRRDERTLRSRIFKFMNLAAFGLSTITAVAVPTPGSDLPLGVEKFGNVLIPGLEELFPNLKEQHRQNIVAQTMKPIEEIPFGSDITRVVFIPKKPIKGLIDGHKARISQVCPFYFKVKVAVVSKGGEVVLGNQIP